MHCDFLKSLLHVVTLVEVCLVGVLESRVLARGSVAQRCLVLVELFHVLLVALLSSTIDSLLSLCFLG